MANQYVNKVEYGNDTLIDLTSDTVTAGDLANGVTAHDRSGAPIVGTGMGGHTIINASGTDMTARAGLQFKSGKVSDDSVNDRTVVEQVVPLTEAQYQALPSSKNSDNTFYFTTDGVTQPLPSLGYTPVGTIISVMGTSAPTNFLACNGQTVNIADYPVLANYFLAQFGQINKFGGDGTTTFGIPDLRGEFLRGTGTNSHSGQGSGASVGTHQDGTEHVYFSSNADGTLVFNNKTNTISALKYDNRLGTDTGKYFHEKTGGDDYSNFTHYTSRPTNTSVLYCIAVRDIYIGKDSALAGRVDAINERFNYSTAEKVVGKWIDRKLLYERAFSFTSAADCSTTQRQSIGMGTFEVDTLVEFQMMFQASGASEVWNPFVGSDVSAGNYGYAGFRNDTGEIWYRSTFSNVNSRPIVGFIRYTKKVDTESNLYNQEY